MFKRTQANINKLSDFKEKYPKSIKCLFCYDKCMHDNYKVEGFEGLKYWTLIHNIAPYEETKKHYTIVLKRHVDNSNLAGIHNEELAELAGVIMALKEMTFIHQGTDHQSEEHFHCHFISF